MKKHFISFLTFSIFAVTVFFSCKGNKDKHSAKIDFDSIAIDETVYLSEGDTLSPNCNLTIDYTFPVKASNPEFLNNVEKTIVGNCFGEKYAGLDSKTAVDSFRNVYIADYKNDLLPLYLEDMKSNSTNRSVMGWYSYYLVIKAAPLAANPSYFVYQIDRKEFQGGAHGTYSTNFYNFDLDTGKLLSLDDLFKPGYKEELTSLLLNKLMTNVQVSSIEGLQEKAYLQLTDMYPTDNFCLDKDGITFFYNIYEIAPYSSGTTSITLSYKELDGLLKSESKL